MATQNDVLISICVLPYVRKYLEKMYPLESDYKLNQNDHFGRQLTLLSELPPAETGYRVNGFTPFDHQLTFLMETNKEDRQYDESLERYTDTWKLWVPARLRKKFTSRVTVRFNQLVTSELKLRLYAQVEMLLLHKIMNREAAIYDFMERHNLSEEDINFRTLLKAYQREELRRLGVSKKKELKKVA